MKEINVKIKKTKNGYVFGNETKGSIDIIDDTDEGRKKLIGLLVEDLLNAEIESGRKYN